MAGQGPSKAPCVSASMGNGDRIRKPARFGAKGSSLCGQTQVLVWLNAVRAIRAWKQTVAVLVAPPVVTIVLVLLQLLANVVVDKEGASRTLCLQPALPPSSPLGLDQHLLLRLWNLSPICLSSCVWFATIGAQLR